MRAACQGLASRPELAPFSWEEVTQTAGRDSFLRRLQNRKTPPARLIAGLKRDFVAGHKARLGVVINNDLVARQYDDNLIGVPFTHV